MDIILQQKSAIFIILEDFIPIILIKHGYFWPRSAIFDRLLTNMAMFDQ